MEQMDPSSEGMARSCYFHMLLLFSPCVTHVTAIASFYIMNSVKETESTDSYLRCGHSLQRTNGQC